MFRTVVTTLGLMLAACSVGEVEGGGADASNDPNEMSFAATIKPVVQRCVDAGCHKTGGIQPSPNFDSFAKLQDKYKAGVGSMNIWVTKAPDGTQHGSGTTTVAYLNATEKTTVGDWIDTVPP